MINIKTFIITILSVALLFAGILFIKADGNNKENFPNPNETESGSVVSDPLTRESGSKLCCLPIFFCSATLHIAMPVITPVHPCGCPFSCWARVRFTVSWLPFFKKVPGSRSMALRQSGSLILFFSAEILSPVYSLP